MLFDIPLVNGIGTKRRSERNHCSRVKFLYRPKSGGSP
jgi:hypothetical protein